MYFGLAWDNQDFVQTVWKNVVLFTNQLERIMLIVYLYSTHLYDLVYLTLLDEMLRSYDCKCAISYEYKHTFVYGYIYTYFNDYMHVVVYGCNYAVSSDCTYAHA